MRIRIMTFGLSMLVAAVVFAPRANAQRWELGGGGGGSFYNNLTISNPSGNVDAGFKMGFAASAYLAQYGKRFGGEIRYSFLKNDLELKGAGSNFSTSGQSHAIHYDALIFLSKQDTNIRPYVAAGGGIKFYQGTGPDLAVQPLGRTAVLTRTGQWKPMISFGGGVRFRINSRSALRAEVKVYASQAPTDVITPVGASTISGWFFNFAPMVSIGYTW